MKVHWREVVTGLLALLLGACDRPTAPVASPPPTVTAMQVVRRDTPVSKEVIAGVKAFQEVEIRSRVGGMLDRVAFKEGHRVQKGELLFAIDPLPLDAAVADAAAVTGGSRSEHDTGPAGCGAVQAVAGGQCHSPADL